MPIDYLALHEQYGISNALGQQAKAKAASDELWRLLAREPDSVLEVVFDYMAVGRRAEARQILEEAIRRGPGPTTAVMRKDVYPMLYYALGYLYQQDGDRNRARAQYALGAKGDPAFVFPHRVEEINILYASVDAHRSDARASYYLGNALASKDRYEEALRAWSSSFGDYPENIIAHRNFARGLWLFSGNKDRSEERRVGKECRSRWSPYH